MRSRNILVLTFAVLFFLSILFYYFLYNVYGTEIRLSPNELFADPGSEITIEVVPINALGYRAFFRSSSATFEIIEGNDLIEKVLIDEEKGLLKIRSIGKTGKVLISIKSQYSLLKEYFEIEIKSLTA